MPNSSVPESPVETAAKRQLRRWLLSPRLRDYMEQAPEPTAETARTGPYVAVSREAGAGGGEIARRVGQLLQWDVLDKELLDFTARRYQAPRDLLEFVDETRARWIHDLFHSFFQAGAVSQDCFIAHLRRVVLLAALHGNVVFIGRGAHCILPRESGLAVRVIAPREVRILRTMARRQLTRREATRYVEHTDTGRHELCKYYFQRDPCEAHQYDLTINTGRIDVETAAREIVTAWEAVRSPAA